jgi:FkbM family methyltransferase
MKNALPPDFVVLDSIYGRFIVNRHCDGQAETLVKTGRTHIEMELDNIRAVLNTLPEGCVVVDGGANIGFVAVPAALAVRAKGGVVHAFEPQRMLYNALCGTVALNSLDNLLVHHRAVGAAPGVLSVPHINYSQRADFGMVTLSNQPGGIPVDVVTIDGIQFPRLDFLKLDIEGYEVPALQGARKTIEKHQPWCWIEYWMSGMENIMSCFQGLDYRFFQMDKLNMLCAPRSRMASAALNISANEVTAGKPLETIPV